jgi:isopentenyldiphosphate isomerase
MEKLVFIADSGLSIADRSIVHAHGLAHYCVHLLCHAGGQLYLQLRQRSRKRNAGKWTSTVSGHITADDAQRFGSLSIDERVARAALHHEAGEELGVSFPALSRAELISKVPSLSRGDGEICRCEAFVFTLNYDIVLQMATEEVATVAPFPVQSVFNAVENTGLLEAPNGERGELADNFAPVFRAFWSFYSVSAPAARVGGA